MAESVDRPDRPRPEMKPGLVPEAPMDGIVPLRGDSAAPATEPRAVSRHAPHGRPGIPPDQPGRGEDAVRLPPGHAAAGLADPGRGRADGDRDVDLGPAAAADLPGRGRGHDRPARVQPGPLDPGLARHRPARSHHSGDVHPQPDRAAQEQGAGRAGGQQPGLASEVSQPSTTRPRS